MKIIHITASYKPAYIYGGPIQSVAKLCEALVELTVSVEGLGIHEVQVLTTTANGQNELDIPINKPVLVDGASVTYFKRLTKDHSHFSPKLLWELKKMRQTPNAKLIIHIHAWWNLVSVLSCWMAKWYKIPVVLSPRGMLTTYTQNNRNSFSKKLLHNLIGKKLLQYCHIHATSEQEKQDILKIVTPKSITVIPNLVNIKELVSSSQLAIDNSDTTVFRLIFLSRIEEKKGLELLFDALSLLDINWQLSIAGSGKEGYVESLKLKAENLKLNPRINWIGQVTDQDKYNLIAKHDLLVLTSFNENFANVVIESLSVGTPVLISDRVGLSDYVREQQLGWVCTLEVSDIKEKLINAYHAQKVREKMKQAAPEVIRRDFNDKALAKRYLELYRRLA
ncbi:MULTISPECIES: XrtY-associated glycosyltransferase XYAG1 [unclassified Pedobacter]|uniref:XrtY-associated glycosyltransferase XYAG1 n=1 Tax=unclassified Pedobacter TaxID=2628915 RepID=UPI00141F6CB2|nr:glycosyltransferase [Pedobacter sp. SG918]NII81318.1 glycosyltransferase involved in cell wall biosynthesis [Pedobacter sp. SG908]NMN35324.1 glycosyltransferase involved in cell wall biosynthesis [Pedobacter sp. SG918]